MEKLKCRAPTKTRNQKSSRFQLGRSGGSPLNADDIPFPHLARVSYFLFLHVAQIRLLFSVRPEIRSLRLKDPPTPAMFSSSPENSTDTSSMASLNQKRLEASAQGRTVHQGQGACVQCQKFAGKGWGKKRYCQCVTVVDAAGNSILGGACSNCAHGDHPEVCSFHSGS